MPFARTPPEGAVQVNDIVRHEVHGLGLVLRIEGYDIQVRFPRGKREVHPAKLEVVLEASQAAELVHDKESPVSAVLWLRAAEPILRATAANVCGRVTTDRHVLVVARAIESWPKQTKERAIEALTAARLEKGLPPWDETVAHAAARASEDGAREAEREAARRQVFDDAAAREIERHELEERVADLSASGEIPATLHRRLLNHARRCRGEVELDELEAVQIVAHMSNAARNRRRESWCWSCRHTVSTPRNEECRYCGWLACWLCGSCEVHRDVDGSPTEMCRATAWARPDISGHADRDARGSAILTSRPPAADADAIASFLTRAGIDRAFHWSPSRSAKSILQHGVLSPRDLDQRGITFVSHFYGSREKAVLLWEFAALSFYPKFQMMESWSSSPVLFEVATDVLLTSGTLFVPGNSASSDFSATELNQMTGLPGAVALLDADGRGPRPQSEAWIPRKIPRAAINQVFVHDEDARTDLLTWLERHPEVRAPRIGLLS